MRQIFPMFIVFFGMLLVESVHLTVEVAPDTHRYCELHISMTLPCGVAFEDPGYTDQMNSGNKIMDDAYRI